VRIAVLLLALAACADESPDLITRISEPRVLGIVAEPAVLAADGATALTVHVVDAAGPRGDDPMQLRACNPWRFVAEPALDCVASDALPLVRGADGRFAISTAELLAAFPPPDGIDADAEALRIALASGLEVRIPVVAEVAASGETLVARRDLHLVAEVGELGNPRLADVWFDGVSTRTLLAGRRYELAATIDPASIDVRPDDPDLELEPIDCYFYSPTGELALHEVDVDEPAVSVQTEPNTYTTGDPGETWLFVVLTDRTGGMTVEARSLAIE
jgi:hypothetical protein